MCMKERYTGRTSYGLDNIRDIVGLTRRLNGIGSTFGCTDLGSVDKEIDKGRASGEQVATNAKGDHFPGSHPNSLQS